MITLVMMCQSTDTKNKELFCLSKVWGLFQQLKTIIKARCYNAKIVSCLLIEAELYVFTRVLRKDEAVLEAKTLHFFAEHIIYSWVN